MGNLFPTHVSQPNPFMKLLRSLLIALVVLLVLAGVAAGLALTPAVQRWAVLRAVRSQPDLEFAATTIAAGLSRIRLEDVVVGKNGITVQLARMEADYSAWQLLAHRRLVIRRLHGSGLVVDASRLSPEKTGTAAAGAPAVGPGILSRIELPFELVLDDCVIEGRARLPGARQGPPVDASFTITGGKFAIGQEGRLTIRGKVGNPRPDSPVTGLNLRAELGATQTAEKTFSRVTLTVDAEAEGQPSLAGARLNLASVLARSSAGEDYSFSIDTKLQGVDANLVKVHARLPAGAQDYEGDWKLLARTEQVTPFFMGASLPEFDARGEGRFTFNPHTAAGSVQGDLEAQVHRLEAIDPAWRALGTVKVTARFNLAQADGVAQLKQLNVAIAGERPVLELSAARAAEINFKERRLQVGGSEAGEALSLMVHGLPLAWVRPFVQGLDISGGTITGQFAITGEPDHLVLRALQPLQVNELTVVQAGQPLLTRGDVALGFDAILTPDELKADVREFSLKTPAGDTVSAHARLTLPVSPDPDITVVATYTADLPTLLAPWLPIGRVKASGEADLTVAGNKLQVRRLLTSVVDAAGSELFKLTALQAFTFDLANQRAEVAGASGAVDLARIALGRIPLAILPVGGAPAKLGGAVTQGEFLLSVDGDRLALRSSGPVKLADVSFEQAGRPKLAGLAIEAQPVLAISGPADIRIQSGDILVRTSRGTLLTAKGEASQTTRTGLQGSLTFALEMPALATQPMFAEAQAVTAGRASGELRVAVGPVNQVEARLTVNGLVAAGSGETLPVANLSFRAVAQANGKVTVQAPLLLDRSGQRSDLNFNLTLAPGGPGFVVDGAVRSGHVELADAMALLGVFMAAGEPPAAAPAEIGGRRTAAPAIAAKIPADAVPAWSRLKGRMGLDIKSIASGDDWAITGMAGVVMLDPAEVILEKLDATVGEKGRLAAKARLGFVNGPRPYRLTGDFSLTDFDAGRLFKALDPAKPATIEGIFSVNGQFTGDGETLDRTIERTRGTFDLTSRAGVFRGLQRTTGKVSMTSKAVELGASVLGSIFGSEKVTKTAEKVAGQAYFVDQLAQSVGELNYDQLSVKLSRDDSLNVTMEDISLVSPEIRLIGKGTITHVAGRAVLEQPLNASLSIAGRGKIEELLGKLKLLSGTKDELGYARTRETVTLGGTLAKPDPTAFFSRIATAKIGDLLAPEN